MVPVSCRLGWVHATARFFGEPKECPLTEEEFQETYDEEVHCLIDDKKLTSVTSVEDVVEVSYPTHCVTPMKMVVMARNALKTYVCHSH
jgi:hypothetical protein